MNYLVVLIILIIVTFSLKVLKLLIKQASINSRVGGKVIVYEPLIALFVWIGFVFWAVNYLFYDKSYYHFIVFALIVMILLFISWFFVKDFIAGVAFKVQNNYASGDIVQFGEISGRLDKLFLTHVSIYTNDGKLVKIPYSRLSNEIVSQKSATGYSGQNSFVFKAAKNKTAEAIKNDLNAVLLNSPWRLPNRVPLVTLISESSDFFDFEIQFETRTKEHLDYVISYLEKKLGRNSQAGKNPRLTKN